MIDLMAGVGVLLQQLELLVCVQFHEIMFEKGGFLLHPVEIHLRLHSFPQRFQTLPRSLFFLDLDLLEVNLRVVCELA